MEKEEFLARLRSQTGILAAEEMPDSLYGRIVEEESTVTGAGGQLPIVNVGLDECSARTHRFCLFMMNGKYRETRNWDRTFHGMVMRDPEGNVLGYDILPEDHDAWAEKDNIVFLSDDFILFADVQAAGQPYMEIRARPYLGEGRWIPEGMRAVIWIPCSTSADIIGRHYGVRMGRSSVGIVALDM